MKGEKVHHPNGTACLEGLRRVPRGFKACCEIFEARTTSCEYDIRFEWWSKDQHWVIRIAESAGGGGIVMRFCPFCAQSCEPVEHADMVAISRFELEIGHDDAVPRWTVRRAGELLAQ